MKFLTKSKEKKHLLARVVGFPDKRVFPTRVFLPYFRVSVVFQVKRTSTVTCLDPRFLSQQPLEICNSLLFFLPVSPTRRFGARQT